VRGHDDFWSALDPASAAELTRRGTAVSFARGRTLLHEGQVPDRVLLLRSGCVKVSRVTEAGREVVLAYREAGELVGDLAAIDGAPRSATIVTIEAIEAIALTQDAFRGFLASDPAAALAYMRMLSLRLREADAMRAEFSTFNTMGRVAARLLELCDRFGREENGRIHISLPISQEELAGSTGASVESVGRALATMRSLKCIETQRRAIQVLDREGLEALRIA
jgi:CRP/FNR family cyclic AMP-dependent transcriptional regulator